MKVLNANEFIHFTLTQLPNVTLAQFVEHFHENHDLVTHLTKPELDRIYHFCLLFGRSECALALTWMVPGRYATVHNTYISGAQKREVYKSLANVFQLEHLPPFAFALSHSTLLPQTTQVYLLLIIQAKPDIPVNLINLPSWVLFNQTFNNKNVVSDVLISCTDLAFLQAIQFDSIQSCYQAALGFNPSYQLIMHDKFKNQRKFSPLSLAPAWFNDIYLDTHIDKNLDKLTQLEFSRLCSEYPLGRLYRHYLLTNQAKARYLLSRATPEFKNHLQTYTYLTHGIAAPFLLEIQNAITTSSFSLTPSIITGLDLLSRVDKQTYGVLRQLSRKHHQLIPPWQNADTLSMLYELFILKQTYFNELLALKAQFTAIAFVKRLLVFMFFLVLSESPVYQPLLLSLSLMLVPNLQLFLAKSTHMHERVNHLIGLSELMLAVLAARPKNTSTVHLEYEIIDFIKKVEKTITHLDTLLTTPVNLISSLIVTIFNDNDSFLKTGIIHTCKFAQQQDQIFKPYTQIAKQFSYADYQKMDAGKRLLIKWIYQEGKDAFFKGHGLSMPKEPSLQIPTNTP